MAVSCVLLEVLLLEFSQPLCDVSSLRRSMWSKGPRSRDEDCPAVSVLAMLWRVIVWLYYRDFVVVVHTPTCICRT